MSEETTYKNPKKFALNMTAAQFTRFYILHLLHKRPSMIAEQFKEAFRNVSRNWQPAPSKSNPVDGREVVWNQLSSEQKVRVNGSWEDASVSTLIFHKNMIDSQKGNAHDGKEVVVMSFPTKDNRMPNNMIIYADKETLDYIGEGTVD